MEFFKSNTKIDFMGQRKWAALFSAILFTCSIASFLIYGLNLGLDFTGGTQIEVTYQKTPELNAIRDEVTKAGFKDPVVQAYGSANDILIRIAPQKEYTQDQLQQKLLSILPGAKVSQIEFIGPKVGRTLVTNGILAIVVSLLATMLYIALRFEFRFAVSAALALVHDPVLIMGIFSFFRIQFDLIALAAVLTIIGYSLNDTIVVFDRVRENFRKVRKGTSLEIMNLSINQTLSRTIMTSGMTLLVVVVLLLLGGETLRPFSIALVIGIVIGTYSSIYVAGALALALGVNRLHLLPPQRAEIDNLP